MNDVILANVKTFVSNSHNSILPASNKLKNYSTQEPNVQSKIKAIFSNQKIVSQENKLAIESRVHLV